ELALRLRARDPDVRADVIASEFVRESRRLAGHAGGELRERTGGSDERGRRSKSGAGEPGDLRERGEELLGRDVVATEDVALADAPLLHRQNVARDDVVDVDDREAARRPRD